MGYGIKPTTQKFAVSMLVKLHVLLLDKPHGTGDGFREMNDQRPPLAHTIAPANRRLSIDVDKIVQ